MVAPPALRCHRALAYGLAGGGQNMAAEETAVCECMLGSSARTHPVPSSIPDLHRLKMWTSALPHTDELGDSRLCDAPRDPNSESAGACGTFIQGNPEGVIPEVI